MQLCRACSARVLPLHFRRRLRRHPPAPRPLGRHRHHGHSHLPQCACTPHLRPPLQIRGIGNPLTAVYARWYLARMASKVGARCMQRREQQNQLPSSAPILAFRRPLPDSRTRFSSHPSLNQLFPPPLPSSNRSSCATTTGSASARSRASATTSFSSPRLLPAQGRCVPVGVFARGTVGRKRRGPLLRCYKPDAPPSRVCSATWSFWACPCPCI